ncbi:MAG: Lrp/AsnC family transcriptional regulator [Crocinitomicaceae bacterium]
MYKIDQIDEKLLMLLQANSNQTIKQLASQLNLTPTPVHERIKRLEKDGIIERYRAEINPAKLGKTLMVISHVSLQEHTKSSLLAFEKKISALPEVIECYHVTGDHDYLLKVIIADMKGYRQFLTEKLAKIANIGNVHSSFVVEAVKNDRIIDLSKAQ